MPPQEPRDPREPVPPRSPWYGRYWGYYNRPYTGCGCLYSLLLIILLWWILAWFFPPLGIWRGWFVDPAVILLPFVV